MSRLKPAIHKPQNQCIQKTREAMRGVVRPRCWTTELLDVRVVVGGVGCGELLDGGVGRCSRLWGGFGLLLEEVGDSIDDFVEGGTWAEAGQSFELIDAGDATHHVLEARLVRLVVGDVFDRRAA